MEGVLLVDAGGEAGRDRECRTDRGGRGAAGRVARISVPCGWSPSTRRSESVISIRLASIDGLPLPPALPGQFVAMRISLGESGSTATRSYSLSSAPGSPEYRISIKREPGGSVSGYVHTKLSVGALVEIAAPRGGFILRDGANAVLLISAGIGATPVLAILSALAADRSSRQVWWLHGARNSAEHAFADEARGLLAQLPNARAEICYSAPLPADRLGSDYTYRGRMDADLLRHLDLPRDASAYLCGPVLFMDDITSALVRSRVANQDRFGPRHSAPDRPSPRASPPARPSRPIPRREDGHRTAGDLHPQRPDRALA